jgi:2-keto-3-deoxy-L-rhamnonate aldolase RhmA
MAGVTRLRDKLYANEPAFGCWLGLANPALVEIVALSGCDYVNIDLEHTSTDLGMVEHVLRAAHSRNISALCTK